GYRVALQQVQRLCGAEPAAGVLDEQGSAHTPGPEERRVRRLCPAGLREVQVKVIWPQIEPEAPCDLVADRVRAVRVEPHLLIADRPGREVDQRWGGASGVQCRRS